MRVELYMSHFARPPRYEILHRLLVDGFVHLFSIGLKLRLCFAPKLIHSFFAARFDGALQYQPINRVEIMLYGFGIDS